MKSSCGGTPKPWLASGGSQTGSARRMHSKPCFVQPLGWPEASPILRSTLSSYRFLRLSSRFWTPAFKAKLLALRPGKRVYVVRRQSDVNSLLVELARQATSGEA